jgi:hypothetical protein
MRKMIPLSVRRQWAGGRPVGFRGQNSWRIGSILCQSASGISQMVPSGLRRALQRPMMATPVEMVVGNVVSHNYLHATGVPPVLG